MSTMNPHYPYSVLEECPTCHKPGGRTRAHDCNLCWGCNAAPGYKHDHDCPAYADQVARQARKDALTAASKRAMELTVADHPETFLKHQREEYIRRGLWDENGKPQTQSSTREET